jgi:phosphatidylserine decarboxylase
MSPHGRVIVIPVLLLALLSGILAVIYAAPLMHIIAAVFTIFTLFSLWFFRDPERVFSGDPQTLCSPADGKVVSVGPAFEHDYLKTEALRISIFLSIFDVHVNRWPIAGKLVGIKYFSGRFLAAFKASASAQNERSVFAIETGSGVVICKQIAGLIARRIIYTARAGQNVQRGRRFGMIRFGSRMDIFLPDNSVAQVKIGDKVRCGETPIAHLQMDTSNASQ